ncbi:MAG TPA: Wzz/FepE/Etk N-terminal domain-containing protein [Candidatus Angelobacter sp.]|nr:Wzz/FepE/Etk N-terminal domain-containing protein [Candidatus Angelobacter sp.]
MSQLPEAAELEQQYPQMTGKSSGKADALWILWQHRRFLWRVFWLSLLASIVVAYSLPKHYQSVARIVPGENSANSTAGLLNKVSGGTAASGLGMDASTLLGLKTPGAFYIEILKSRTVQDRLIQKFDLTYRYRLCRWCSRTSTYSARKKLKAFSDFEEDKKSSVITITVTDYEPGTAADMANAYVAELNRLAADLNASAAHREREFLEERLQTAKQELDEAALELSRFSSNSYVMDPQNQQRSIVDAAARLEGELVAAQTELRGLQQLYSEDNVRVRTLRARLGELQAQLRKLEGNPNPSSATNDKAATGPYPSLRSLPGLNYRYADLYRRSKIQESVYEFLTQQYEMAKLQEVKELPTVRVMDAGVPPERKSGPIRTLVVGLSVFFAMLLAGFWVMERHRWRQLPADDTRRLVAAEISTAMRSALSRFKR